MNQTPSCNCERTYTVHERDCPSSPIHKVTEKEVISAIMLHVMDNKSHVFAIPNSKSILSWSNEADVFSATQSGLSHEWEVKLSTSDYKNDFTSKKSKHNRLKTGHGVNIACYFWFVTTFTIEPPEYAGWALYLPSVQDVHRRIEVMKEAPRLHGKRMWEKDYERAARLLTFRVAKMYKQLTDDCAWMFYRGK